MSVVKVSPPSKQQALHGAERVLAVFLISALGVFSATPDSLNRATAIAAVTAGITAVYQLILSSLTNL